MSRWIERQFSKMEEQITNSTWNSVLPCLPSGKCKLKQQWGLFPHSIQNGSRQEDKCPKILGWFRENKPNILFMGTKTREATMKTHLEAPQKLKIEPENDPAPASTQNLYPKDSSHYSTGIPVCWLTCVHTAEMPSQLRYPQTAEMSRYRKRHAWTVEFCSDIKQKAVCGEREAGRMRQEGSCRQDFVLERGQCFWGKQRRSGHGVACL